MRNYTVFATTLTFKKDKWLEISDFYAVTARDYRHLLEKCNASFLRFTEPEDKTGEQLNADWDTDSVFESMRQILVWRNHDYKHNQKKIPHLDPRITALEVRMVSLISNIAYWRRQLYWYGKPTPAQTKESASEIQRCQQLFKAAMKDLDKLEKERGE